MDPFLAFLEGPLPNNSCYRTGLGFGVFLGRSKNVDPGGMFVLELFRKVERRTKRSFREVIPSKSAIQVPKMPS